MTQTADELSVRGAVTFRVRPLAGPGSMGPHELSPESDGALEEVRALLASQPGLRLRIQCAVNPMMMSSSPDPRWGAQLALLVARWLVDHGVDCRRLEPVGILDGEPGAPAEKVSFFAADRSPARPSGATADPCAPR